MSGIKPATIAMLRELDQKASHAPWESCNHPRIDSREGAVTKYPCPDNRAWHNPHDRELVVALRNEAQALLDAAQENAMLRHENEAMRTKCEAGRRLQDAAARAHLDGHDIGGRHSSCRGFYQVACHRTDATGALKRKKPVKIITHEEEGNRLIFVRMTRDEAVRTIKSLAAQIASNNPNGERYEHADDSGTNFSIAVMPQE